MWIGLMWLMIGSNGGLFKEGTEPYGSVKDEIGLDVRVLQITAYFCKANNTTAVTLHETRNLSFLKFR